MAVGWTSRIRREKHREFSVRWAGAIAALVLLAAPATANTTFFTNTGTVCTVAAPCWQAGTFGLLVGISNGSGGFSTGTLTESSGAAPSITGQGAGGDIGIGPGSLINTNAGAAQTWTGPIDFADNGNKKSNTYTVPTASDNLNHLTITGGTLVNQATTVDAALNQILSISNTWLGASGQQSLGTLGLTSRTIGTIGAGIQVFSVNSINVTSVITIQGNAGDMIIINDPSKAIFAAGGKIVLSGLTPDQVLFNLTGTGTVLSISGGDAIAGDFIVRGSYNVSNATVYGRILGGTGTLTLGQNFVETIPDNATPEPGEWALMAGGLGALLYLGRKLPRRGRRDFKPPPPPCEGGGGGSGGPECSHPG
jgi:hypothetical protein